MMVVVHIISGLTDGGAEAVLYRLCRYNKASQHHVVTLMDGGKYGPLLEAEGVQVTCLNMPRGRFTLNGGWRLWQLIRKTRPDAVQTWMYHADLLGGTISVFAGQRNVSWGIHHSSLDSSGNSRSTLAVARLCAWLSRILPRNIICCAQKSADVHGAFGYDVGRIHVVPNGYDLSEYKPDPKAGAELRSQLGLALDTPVIGFVARFNPLKDHDNLFNALGHLKARGVAPICLLVGDGMVADNEVLVERITQLGLGDHVRLLGRRSDIPAVMNVLDLHVMSSSSEAFPNVLAEAMACGTPCVSTDVGDAAAIVGKTGLIVPPGNAEALAGAIETLLAELAHPFWGERCAEARRHVETHFSIERMVENYHALWQRKR